MFGARLSCNQPLRTTSRALASYSLMSVSRSRFSLPCRRGALRLGRALLRFFLASPKSRSLLVEVLSGPQSDSEVRRIWKVTLKASGFNPSGGFEESGEYHLVRHLARSHLSFAVDVGANVGHYSSMLLAVGAERVVCYEPNPQLFAALERLAYSNGSRFTPRSSAVGDSVGKADLLFNEETPQLASLSPEANRVPYVNNESKVEVMVTTLDAESRSWSAQPDFVKVETEGFEIEVLRGAQTLLRDNRKMIVQVEMNQHHLFRGVTLREISDFFHDAHCFRILPGQRGLLEVNPLSPYANLFFFSNYVFVSAEYLDVVNEIVA